MEQRSRLAHLQPRTRWYPRAKDIKTSLANVGSVIRTQVMLFSRSLLPRTSPRDAHVHPQEQHACSLSPCFPYDSITMSLQHRPRANRWTERRCGACDCTVGSRISRLRPRENFRKRGVSVGAGAVCLHVREVGQTTSRVVVRRWRRRWRPRFGRGARKEFHTCHHRQEDVERKVHVEKRRGRTPVWSSCSAAWVERAKIRSERPPFVVGASVQQATSNVD